MKTREVGGCEWAHLERPERHHVGGCVGVTRKREGRAALETAQTSTRQRVCSDNARGCSACACAFAGYGDCCRVQEGKKLLASQTA